MERQNSASRPEDSAAVSYLLVSWVAAKAGIWVGGLAYRKG